jgi:hypothetical protein
MMFTMAMFVVGAAANALPACKCATTWTEPSIPTCASTFSGCPATPCDADPNGPWCMISNLPCATEETVEGGGWTYCTPPKEPWWKSICA